jgi:prephenate dehydratase
MAYADTAGAAAFIKEQGDPAAAAIAPALAASLYDLDIIENNVEDAADNTTRFVVLARAPLDPATIEGTAMTTMIFEVRNVSAALYKALGGFATNGVNMTKLESYQRAPVSRPRCFLSISWANRAKSRWTARWKKSPSTARICACWAVTRSRPRG